MHAQALPWRPRLWLAFGLLLVHSACLLSFEVPGVPLGKLVENQTIVDLWNSQYLAPIYLKGLFSLLPTSALAIIGSLIGEGLLCKDLVARSKLGLLLASGLGLTSIGWLWGRCLPYSKTLWTASYICVSAGLAALTLALFFLLIDYGQKRNLLLFFTIPGSNAIFAYVVPILVKVHIWQEWRSGGTILQDLALGWAKTTYGAELGGWVYTLSWVGFWWIVLAWMYQTKRFWKV